MGSDEKAEATRNKKKRKGHAHKTPGLGDQKLWRIALRGKIFRGEAVREG